MPPETDRRTKISIKILELLADEVMAMVHKRPLICIPLILVIVVGIQSARADAPACAALGMALPPSGLETDFNDCCLAHASCYVSTGSVQVRDWPRAFTPAAFGCNIEFFACIGVATTGNLPAMMCPGTCSYEGIGCGETDGCGHACVSSKLCPLFLLRPELIVAILGNGQ
jgi:hypothetical protein